MGRKTKIYISWHQVYDARKGDQQEENICDHDPQDEHKTYQTPVFNTVLNDRKHNGPKAKAKGDAHQETFQNGMEVKPALTHAAAIERRRSSSCRIPHAEAPWTRLFWGARANREG